MLRQVISGYSFSAGDPLDLADTYTDDFQTPGNPYLANHSARRGLNLGQPCVTKHRQ